MCLLGLESLLQLCDFLTADECTSVINTMAIENNLTWHCGHIKYLIIESEKPGSGIAKSLSVNLSIFLWNLIFTKQDFDPEVMQTLLSLGAVISQQNLFDVINIIPDDKTEILSIALNQCTQLLNEEFLNTLCVLSLKNRKGNFFSYLISQGVELDIESILKEIPLLNFLDQKILCDNIQANPENCMVLLKHCLRKCNVDVLEQCKPFMKDFSEDDIQLTTLILALSQANREKQKHGIKFLQWLLEENLTNPNAVADQMHPLDAAFGIGSDIKEKLYYLLIQHGASVQNSKLFENERANVLQYAVIFAINSSEYFKLLKMWI